MKKKIFQILKIIFLFRFQILPPRKKKYLLFDDNHKNYLLKYIKENDLEVLHIRKEKINLSIVIFNFLKFKFTFRDYLETYIDFTSPRFIVTFSDNSESFFILKKRKNSKKVLIQNSWKNRHNDTFLNIDHSNFNCDYLFTFNKKIGDIYSKILKCEPIIVGSFKNNSNKIITNNIKTYEILFISSFRNFDPSKFITYGMTFKDYDLFQRQAIKETSECIKQNKLKLYIYGSDPFNSDIEKNYYDQLSLNCNWEFIKNDRSKTYQIMDQSNLIIGTHSTAIYEAIGRGIKVFVFSRNYKEEKLNTQRFGWPYAFQDEGFFWVNNFSNKYLINKKIETILNLSQIDWFKKIHDIREKLMFFDNGNKKFNNLLKVD